MTSFTVTSRGRRRRSTLFAVVLVSLALSSAGCTEERALDEPAEDRGCVTGTLTTTAFDAEAGDLVTHPARAVTWSLSGPAGTVQTGLTDSRGDFRACTDGVKDDLLTLTFATERDSLWRVSDVDDPTTAYSFSVEDLDLAEGAADLGALAVPEDVAPAFAVVNSVGALYNARGTQGPCWTGHQDSLEDCHTATLVWSAGLPEAEGGFWDPETGHIVLSEVDASSPSVVAHELAHWWQNELYGGSFPEVTDCSPHFIDRPSSPSCAWTEGFADAVAAWVLERQDFVASDGTVTPFVPVDAPAWPGGDSTQGNVAAALLDLWALAADEDAWEANVTLFSTVTDGDFRSYFTVSRPRMGLSTTGDALKVIRSHGITI